MLRAYRSFGIVLKRFSSSLVGRDPKFAQISTSDIETFHSILGERGVVTDEKDLASFNEDWTGKYTGKSRVALLPSTTEQVAKVLSHCNARRLAVVPQGGKTGLVGGSVPLFDEVILSTSRMNKVIHFDKASGVLTMEAGCILAELDRDIATSGFMMPIDLAASGSCQIGGNISTNAGGVRVLRFGSLRTAVLGLKVVLADGTIVDTLSGMKKDNTGMDVKQLFIGSEGLLGVITAASLQVPVRPKAMNVMFVALPTYEAVTKFFVCAKEKLGEVLSAFEFLDWECMNLVVKHANLQNPLSENHKFYVLLETAGSNGTHDMEKIQGLLEHSMNAGIVSDGTIAEGTKQAQDLWTIRERLPEEMRRVGKLHKFDVSLPLANMYDLVEETRQRVGDRGVTYGFGHIGDNNLHLNINCQGQELWNDIGKGLNDFVFRKVAEYKGSISAEHGIGWQKRSYIHYSKSKEAIDVMRKLKAALDPNGILNPYKMIPPLD